MNGDPAAGLVLNGRRRTVATIGTVIAAAGLSLLPGRYDLVFGGDGVVRCAGGRQKRRSRAGVHNRRLETVIARQDGTTVAVPGPAAENRSSRIRQTVAKLRDRNAGIPPGSTGRRNAV